MPFDGSPVFLTLRASLSKESATPLLNFHCPFGVSSSLARRQASSVDHRLAPTAPPTLPGNPLERLLLFSACSREIPPRRGC